jgi:hypothetical protein
MVTRFKSNSSCTSSWILIEIVWPWSNFFTFVTLWKVRGHAIISVNKEPVKNTCIQYSNIEKKPTLDIYTCIIDSGLSLLNYVFWFNNMKNVGFFFFSKYTFLAFLSLSKLITVKHDSQQLTVLVLQLYL